MHRKAAGIDPAQRTADLRQYARLVAELDRGDQLDPHLFAPQSDCAQRADTTAAPFGQGRI